MQGGPTVGQVWPGLDLGGPLQADASGGGTQVFINGRELHPVEVDYLRGLFGYVLAGRYWLNAMGIGGYEGGHLFSIYTRRPGTNPKVTGMAIPEEHHLEAPAAMAIAATISTPAAAVL